MNEFPAKKEGIDYAHIATKTLLSGIPMVGGSLTVIFETIFSSPIDKRKEEWLKQLVQTVDELCNKVNELTPEKLRDNPEFISFYLQASNIAIRTHSEEKLKILNVAVKNCVLLKDIDESKKMIFLRIIEQMTPLHIKIFHFLSFPEKYLEPPPSPYATTSMSNTRLIHRRDVWNKHNPDIPAENPLINFATNELKNFGLVNIDILGFQEMKLSCITDFGKAFIEFTNENI